MSRDAVTKNSVVKRIIHVQILCLKLNLRWKWTIVQDKDTKLSQDSSPLRLMLLALACLKTSRGNRRLRARYHFLVTVFAAHALPSPMWTQWYVNAPKHGQKGDSLCLPCLQTHPPTNTQTLFRGEILIKMTSFAGRGGGWWSVQGWASYYSKVKATSTANICALFLNCKFVFKSMARNLSNFREQSEHPT